MATRDSQGKGIGLVLVILGILFLVFQFTNINIGWFAWPFFVIVPGVLFLAAGFMFKQSAAGLVIPGSIVTMIGLILFTQNVTGRFETWSYVWALIPTAVGIGIYLQGMLTQNDKLRTDGSRLVMIGLVLLVAFGAFFELFIFNRFANSFAWRYIVPILLIAGGAYLFMRRKDDSIKLNDSRKPPDVPKAPQT